MSSIENISSPPRGHSVAAESSDRAPILANAAYLIPAIVALLAFFILPTFVTIGLSFTDWRLGARSLSFVGLDNYRDLLASGAFNDTLWNTLKLNLFVIPTSFLTALLLALAIHSQTRLAAFWQTVFFLPVTSTLVAMAIVWQWVLHPQVGMAAWVLRQLGLNPINWLNDPDLVLYTIGFISMWQLVGYYMVLFLAGLLAIPRHLYEAAQMDGARSGLDRFVHVTWPMLGPTALFVLIITIIKSLQIFDVVRVLTKGGPNGASEIILHTLYQEGFIYFRTGIAAAIATLFFLVMLALTLYQMRVFDRRVHYS
ncbi:carbohydrate ABC transporter permease [Aliihoeflea sp. 40Bstr573]|jgi:multiple sugar transport system permease protein|uniref:carbohydrate ABC transporter permease n=1 Tax=Aliihoeflea sp. 40Bstr573 TaxID=2696467 RepID=UPI0020961409|nr:sugar ABC transporter permease [Aliihoeflea sp. 40Bstr573]MCO6387091.1 ABC transporter permease subunit [Aliihoeflea sp. 40Bstr573]